MNGFKKIIKKILTKLIRRVFLSETFKDILYSEMYNYITNFPKVIGPKERLIFTKYAGRNNFYANTNSGTITINDYVFFGKNVSLITGTHNYNVFNEDRINDYPKEGRDIVLEKGVWVASNSIILGPCRVGEGAVIAAGSVVFKDVEPYTIVAGNPAKKIKDIKHG